MGNMCSCDDDDDDEENAHGMKEPLLPMENGGGGSSSAGGVSGGSGVKKDLEDDLAPYMPYIEALTRYYAEAITSPPTIALYLSLQP